jgi:tetratricopeptide (TPR) repeat protein
VPKIIISYRRSDSDVFAGRVRDRIAGRFGEDSVFIDVDNIPFGKDFRVHIQEALAEADAVLIIVGPRWLGASKANQNRIMDDSDPVRIELETALSKGIPTIPILVGQTKMPKQEQLPESLKSFTFVNAAAVDTGRDFHRDLERVIDTINTILKRSKDAAGIAFLPSGVATEMELNKGEEPHPRIVSEANRRAEEEERSRLQPLEPRGARLTLRRTAVIGSLIAAVIIGAIGVWTVIAPEPQSVPSPPPKEGCGSNIESIDQRISGCTAVIQSGEWSGIGLAMLLNLRGEAYAEKKDYDQAIADFSQALDHVKHAEFYRNRGSAYGFKKDYDRAIADFSQAIQLEPKSAGSYSDRGIAYWYKKDYDLALADFNQAIQLNPAYADAYLLRASIYGIKDDDDLALTDLNQVIQLNHTATEAYVSRGSIYYRKKDYDRAIADFSQAIQLNPKNGRAYNNRGFAYRAIDEFDHAIDDLNQAIQYNIREADTYRTRGDAYRLKKDYDRAVADYDQAIQLDPKDAAAYYHRGLAKGAQGDGVGRDADIAKARQLDPNVGN